MEPPITMQPIQQQFYPLAESFSDVPLGPLAPLENLDELLVRQKREMVEIMCGCETKNRYEIYSRDCHLFNSKEDTNCCTRNCCGPIRPFDMSITAIGGQEVIHLDRPLACQSCICPCCLQSISVYSTPGNLIGTVKQNWSLCAPSWRLLDEQGNVKLRMSGPCFHYSCCCNDIDFDIYSPEGVEVGQISKKWGGFCKEALSDADNFAIRFPREMDVKSKALILGSCFLLDFMYFEQEARKPKKSSED